MFVISSVEWIQDSEPTYPNRQAPAQIRSLFNGERLVVYGFVDNCTRAVLHAKNGEEEIGMLCCNMTLMLIECMVSTTELSTKKGSIIHTLTARAIIRDWEDSDTHGDAAVASANKVRECTIRGGIIRRNWRNLRYVTLVSNTGLSQR